MSLSEQVILMKQSLSEVEEHLNKLQSGRKASSAKARASLMKLKKDSHQLRGDIMKYTKELPVKSRVKKEEQIPMEEIRQLQAQPEEPQNLNETLNPEQEEKPKASTKKAKPKKRLVKKKVSVE